MNSLRHHFQSACVRCRQVAPVGSRGIRGPLCFTCTNRQFVRSERIRAAAVVVIAVVLIGVAGYLLLR